MFVVKKGKIILSHFLFNICLNLGDMHAYAWGMHVYASSTFLNFGQRCVLRRFWNMGLFA